MRHARVHAHFAALLTAAAFLLGGCGEREHPSIVLITIDTLRADRLGCYGYFRDTSPTLDRFAEESLLFQNTLTVMGTTLPAHISLLTSVGTLTHGIKGNYEPFRTKNSEALPPIQTFAQILAGMDYATAAFVSSTPLKKHWGLAVGFDVYNEPEASDRRARQTTGQALKWLNKKHEKPFFLWVHYFDPHSRYDPPGGYRQLFKKDAQQIAYLKRLGIDVSNTENVKINNLYDGEVRYVDDQIGRLFDKLKEMQVWDEAAVVVTADHGEGLGQHRWQAHGHIYNEQLFIPLIMKLPLKNAVKSSRKTQLASILDVVPTLIKNLNLPVNPTVARQFEGIDLLGDHQGRDYLFAERTKARYGARPGKKVKEKTDWIKHRHYALTNLKWKYLLRTNIRDSLYNMERDQAETENLIDKHPELASELKRRILQIVSTTVERAKSESVDTPKKLEEELRSLGYLE